MNNNIHTPIFSSKAIFISKSALSLFIFGFMRLLFRFSATILVARILGPKVFGFWAIVELINKFSPIGTLGIPSGVKREIPYWIGKKNRLKANELVNTGFVWMIGYCIILSCSGIIYFFLSNNEILIRFAILSTLIGAGLSQFYQYLNVLLLAEKKFYKSSIFSLLEGFLFFVFSISLVYSFNIYGQLLILPIVSAVMIGSYFLIYKPDLNFKWNPSILSRTIKIGFLIIMVGMGYMLLLNINRIMLERYLGFEAVGLFAFGMLLITLFSQLTGSLGEVIYTFMNEHIGKYERVDNMNKLVFYPAIGKILFLPILTGITIIIIPYFIDKFLPQYIESIKICQIILVLITLTSGSIDILGSFLKQKLLLLFLFFAIILNIIISLFTLYNDFGIIGISISLLVSILFYRSLVTLASLCYMKISKGSFFKYSVFSHGYPIIILFLITPLSIQYGSNILQIGLFSAIVIIPLLMIFIARKNPKIYNFN